MRRTVEIFFLTLCLTATYLSTFGQSYNFINYNIDDGLAHEKITDICQDKFGNLWLATLGGGLSCFNGIGFRNYTEKDGLANNIVRDVLVDKNGYIWAATANGISMFDGRRFVNYLTDSISFTASINVIANDDQNTIWFSYPDGGLGYLDHGRLDQRIELEGWIKNDKIIDIAINGDGSVYFITAIKGLFKYDKKELREVLGNSDFKGYLLDIEIASDSTFLLGSNKGLVTLNLNRPMSYDVRFPDKFITSSVFKSKNEAWFISANRAIRYKNHGLRLMNELHGFTNTAINKIFSDREGNDWFATNGDGLYKLANDVFEFYGPQHGLTRLPVSTITKDLKGNYWAGIYGGGVTKITADGQISEDNSFNLMNQHITASATDKQGNIWFGTRNAGLIKYDGVQCYNYTKNNGVLHNSVRVLFNDSQNNLWVGKANGLSVCDSEQFYNFTTEDGLYDDIIWGISEPQPGKILIVSRKGLNYYRDGRLEKIVLDENIFDRRVNVCLEDSLGNFWIGYSGHGILRISADKTQETHITAGDGLSSDLIYNMVFDNDGNLVVGSERGIDKLYLDEANEVERIKNYGRVEGFDGIRTSYSSVYKEKDGSIWFGNSQGIIKYKAFMESLNTNPPLVYISGIRLFDNNVNWTEYSDGLSNWHNIPSNLKLPHDDNNVIIEYFGNSLRNPDEVNYQFRLSGLQKEWSPLTEKKEVVYTNLPPGDYTFEVKAANSDGVWSREYAEFTFSIVPPFWMEPWFFIIVAILIILGIKFFNDYRVKKNLDKLLTIERIRAEELVKVRKRMARDFHDNMGNQLASITVFTNLISLKLKDKSLEINDLLLNIEKHTKSLFNGTKDFIWSMDPDSDNLNELFTYIKDFGEELFENTRIDFFSGKDDFVEKPLPSGWSRQIVLVFKEAMTNALKHSQSTEVHFELNLNENSFVLRLWDNGHGVPADYLKKGNGFKNMSSRATQIGCTLNILNGNQQYGLAIELKGKLQSEPRKSEVKLYKTTML